MRLIAGIATLALAGCQTTLDPNFALQLESYRLTISAQREVDVAKARAEEARYVAMAQIAERADPQSKQMAILALALGGRSESAARPVEVQLPRIPESQEDRALKWAAVFAGPTTAIATGYFGYRLGQTQSNNQAATTQASYSALVAFKPGPALPTSSTVNNIWTNTQTETRTEVQNRDGVVAVGEGNASQDNRVTPVVPIVPVVVVPPVVPIVPVVTGP
jgi:hypothetical protein